MPMYCSPTGSATEVSAVAENAASPMDVIEFEKLAVVSDEHSENALLPIEVNEFGKLTAVSDEHW